jgi:hypothetical protein
MIPFSILGAAHYTSNITQYFVDKGLRKYPIEDRGIGEGILIPGIDIRAILARERKRFDPLGAFPEVMYTCIFEFVRELFQPQVPS